MGKPLIVEMDKVRDQYPEFDVGAQKLFTDAVDKAKQQWPGFTYGGQYPSASEFGKTTLLPKFLTGYAGAALTNYRQYFGSVNAWNQIFNKTIDEDVIHGMMGFAFPDPTIRFTELRYEIGDIKYPRINIEEINCYNQPAVIFRQGIIAMEETPFLVKGYLTSTGYQRVVPVESFTLFKKKADVISE